MSDNEQRHASRPRSILRRGRPLFMCVLMALVLTWVVACALAFFIEPRRGTTAAGEVWRSPATFGAIQTWDSPFAVYVEATWQAGFKRLWGPEQATGSPDTHGPGTSRPHGPRRHPMGRPSGCRFAGSVR